ncbi:hypothetical protein ACFRCG_41830 [Embleya sp. NPDC056575]|uniref:hypothetical protein n=1 Tax=unclassified Embleya TaxID=2699296 RepID=UPI0036A69526
MTAAAAYIAASANLRAGLLGYIGRAFMLRAAWNRPDAAWFATTVAPTVIGSQRYMATLTDRYIAASLAEQTGAAVDPVGVELPEDLRGVPTRDVYERPYVQLWTDLKHGKPFDQALDEATRRATVLADTDLQMARTHASRAAMQGQPGAAGWKRVPTGPRNCLLCLVASTQRYRRQDLAAIHPQCHCIVEPIPGTRDPGQIIDPELLARVHQAVEDAGLKADRGGRNPDYRQLIVTNTHGELGPVLSRRDQQFTGPDDLNGGGSATS